MSQRPPAAPAPRAPAADGETDLRAVLARARSAEVPGPDTDPGPLAPAWPGPGRCMAQAGPGELDLWWLLRLSLAAGDAGGRLRPAPSAGGCHPVDAVLTVGPDCSEPPGRYGYQPLTHRLHPLGPAPPGTPPGATVALDVTLRRTAGHYGHRAWPLVLLDTGHAAAALHLAADALGIPAAPDLDGTAAHPLATVRFRAPTADNRPLPARTRPTARQLLARRSAGPPLTGQPELPLLRQLLATAGKSGDNLGWCVALGPPDPHLLTLDPGGAPRRLAAGDARPALAGWAAGQAWIAEAGAVLLAHGCPDDSTGAAIRRAHLQAGYGVGLALGAADAAGLRTRPVGSWQHADLGAALGGPPGRDRVVHGLVLAAAPGQDGPAPTVRPGAEPPTGADADPPHPPPLRENNR
ncbi:SagB/ThcOx family dehydrogenase [Streptomyces sp. 549]|uniref:SagB/ThcOx family dehydrogenase n=1 Tax=Streptomyces sp. 549 TaxID=3049076 RepID=UPI0024C366C1|nr:SagB/ThcOx family dehydrogenase [Streptomyces sp. 549]MDK1475273.1 SagB/ThcOx family dehydrogenase [Streptomyces sp. 549]